MKWITTLIDKIYKKNLTDEEIKILKKQGKFTQLPYMGPKD